jgi:hypothetical protein
VNEEGSHKRVIFTERNAERAAANKGAGSPQRTTTEGTQGENRGDVCHASTLTQ